MAHAEMDRIERRFRAQYVAAGRPGDMAVFIRHVSEGQLHCDVILYFPPAAAELAAWAHADPCPPPARPGLGMMVGSDAAWDLLFSE
ncbi:MAG: hypothetical protein JJT90_15930 [Ectothiorhodospiraceae bacterium]|nr:hypothetical protein [Ectothiorhodospiraceae bacterium]